MIKKYLIFMFLVPFFAMAQKTDFDLLLSELLSFSTPIIKVSEKIDSNSIFIDARSRKEYNESHIKNAIFVEYENFYIGQISLKFKNKNTPIIVYCTVGYRSEKISEKLISYGYTNVKNLYGGIIAWKNYGKLLVDTENVITENVHVYSKEWGKWLEKGKKVYE